jgi:acyl carrier protein
MERAMIAEQVFDLICETAGTERAILNETTSQSDLGIDSILMIDLMLTIESRLGITFKSLDLPRNPTIGDIIAMIESEMDVA